MAKATHFKSSMNIQKLSGYSYIRRITRSSLRYHSFLVYKRDDMLAHVLAVVVCLYVCRPMSVAYRYCINRSDCMDRAVFLHTGFIRLTLLKLWLIWYYQKEGHFPLELCLKNWTWTIWPRYTPTVGECDINSDSWT